MYITRSYRCQCGYHTELFDESTALPSFVQCAQCGQRAHRCFPAPALLHSNKRFVAKTHFDDGFGDNHYLRTVAKQKAAAAGISTTGKRYCPSLCPAGEPLSPKAWVSDFDEARTRAKELGLGSEELGLKPRRNEGLDKKAEQPYRVADSLVETVQSSAPELAAMPKEAVREMITPRL